MVEDLKLIAGLPDEQIATLRQQLRKASHFLNPKALLATIQEVVQVPESGGAVCRAILNLNPSNANQIIANLEKDLDDKDFPFERLKMVMSELIQPYPALARFEKAERLAKVTGRQLETIDLICDLRPIFDENQKNLEGMMPYTRLHIVVTGEDGLPKPFEAELTHQQVADLAEKAEKAKSKLKVLRQSVENWLPGGLPDLPLTRTPPKESNDA
jgi:hypothetical protein